MCKNDMFLWNKDRLKLGSGFKVQGSGFARGRAAPFIPDESSASNEEWGVRSAGAAHKNQKRRGGLRLAFSRIANLISS